ILELQFSKFEAAICEHGRQLRPSVVADDVNAAALQLRHPGLSPAAFFVAIEAPREPEYQRQFKAVCRLARIMAVPLVSLLPARLDVSLDDEVHRLRNLVRLADNEGILLTVATHTGTHTETPEQAIELCKQVPGLGLTLDPS